MAKGRGRGNRTSTQNMDGPPRGTTGMVYQRLGEGFAPLEPNARVRLRTTISPLELRAATGTVVGPADYEDYYLVSLDVPAIYHDADGGVRELNLICAGVDNLERIAE